ncbi:MAG: hypothetical protein CBC13_06295 [Planctomycetia bacterium TMED53]|nr:MAG: hypothetical protein CBC13_06295 [Planctomycetia bacterium TMED53]
MAVLPPSVFSFLVFSSSSGYLLRSTGDWGELVQGLSSLSEYRDQIYICWLSKFEADQLLIDQLRG